MPPIPDDIRQRVRQEVAEQGTGASHERLALVDPVVAERLKTGGYAAYCPCFGGFLRRRAHPCRCFRLKNLCRF